MSTSPSGARGEGQREVRIARSPWRLADGPGLQGRRRSREVPGRDGSVTMASGAPAITRSFQPGLDEHQRAVPSFDCEGGKPGRGEKNQRAAPDSIVMEENRAYARWNGGGWVDSGME